MALYYLDASALVKYYILEPGSAWVRELINNSWNAVVISDASIAESAAAFSILFRAKRIHRKARDGAFHSMMRDVAQELLKAMPLMTGDFNQAAYLTQHHPLKAYDAIQLAVALRHSRVMAEHGLAVIFVSGDNALIRAAQAEGLPTDNPFEHIAPQDTPQVLR